MNKSFANQFVPGDALHDGVIILTLFQRADAPVLLEADSDPDHRRYFDFPKEFKPSLAHCEQVIARWEAERMARKRFPYAVRNVTTRELIGGIELKPRDAETANLSYWTSPRHRHQGVASRAVSLACRLAFSECGFRVIVALIHPDNFASRQVVARNAFREIGIQGEQLLYVLEATAL